MTDGWRSFATSGAPWGIGIALSQYRALLWSTVIFRLIASIVWTKKKTTTHDDLETGRDPVIENLLKQEREHSIPLHKGPDLKQVPP